MSRNNRTVCLLCRLSTVWQQQPVLFPPAWQQTRSLGRMQKRRPPRRMSLSPQVAQTPPRRAPTGRGAVRAKTSPFAGMNRRSADLRYAPKNTRSAAQIKRSSTRREPEKKERDPFHALKMQKALSDISYGHRNAIKGKIQEKDSFMDFPLMASVQEAVTSNALAGLDYATPTPIQRLAIPAILGDETRASRRRTSDSGKKEMEQFLLAAETGSGKTLAYLLPILHAIKQQEATDVALEAAQKAKEEEERKTYNFHAVPPPPLTTAPHSTTARPRAIILLPTSELVTQVGNLAKSLSHSVKFRSALISSAYTGKVIRNRLFAPTGIDVLITTPHLLASISESDPNILSRVTHLVIDEADSLFDRSFAPSTSIILDKVTPSLKQLVLCSATIPRSLDSYLRRRFPDMRRLVTPNLHAIPRRVQLGVVDIEKQPYLGNKMLACADTIWSIGKIPADSMITRTEPQQVKRILVFVNEREKSKEVADYLVAKGIEAVCLNRDTAEQRQNNALTEFTTRESHIEVPLPRQEVALLPTDGPNFKPVSGQPESLLKPVRRHLPNTKVLVTTDLGSRGIDTRAVKTVILFDVPHSTVDFIHRLGRTGRMGMRGRGIVLVGKRDRRDVVKEVREGMFRGQALI